ncbi:MAG: insulinase family protein [Bacteroidia bacterium]|nr:insulinase family protein [Bacteroidia bacterium]
MDSLIPLHEKLVFGKLKNGIRYYILKNKQPENRAELRLVVQTGSNNENEQQLGLAHFTEHMAFNGTKKYKKSEIVDYLESIGTKFGPDLNAYTSFDETVYMLQIPTDKKEIIEKGLEILLEWSAYVALDSVEVEKERGVVLEEWRLGKGATDRMFKKVLPVIFRNSRYAERLPIGKPEVLQNFKHQVLRDYYNKWYRPELQSIVVVGDVDVKYIEELIKKNFSKIPASKKPIKPVEWPVNATGEFTCVVASDPESPFNMLQWFMALPKREFKKYSDYKKNLIENLAVEMLNKRLKEYTIKPDPPFSFGGVSIGGFISNAYSLSGFLIFPNGKWQKAAEALLTELERVKRHGFTEQELELVKKEMLKNAEDKFKEADKTESKEWTSEIVQYILKGDMVLSAETDYRLTKKFLNEITLEDLNKLSKIFMTDQAKNCTMALMMAEKENNPIPTENEIKQAVQKIISETDIAAYVPKKLDKPFLKSKAIKQKVIKQEDLKYGFVQWTLGNGAKVWLKPTNFKNNEILMTAYSHGGHSLYADKDFLNASFADDIQGKMNFGNYDPEMMEKFLSDKTCSVYFGVGQFSEEINGQSSVKDLEVMLQWVYAGFTQPRYDSALFVSWKNTTRAFYENNNSPERIFSDSLEYYLYGKNPRIKPLTAKDLEQILPEATHKIFKERFYDPTDFTFIIVGSFNLDSIRPLVEKYIGGISNGTKKENPGPNMLKISDGKMNKAFYAGIEPKSMVQLVWNSRIPYQSRKIFEARCLSMLMSILLRENLREDKGGVYGVGFNITPLKYPEEMAFARCFFGCSPENVDKLIASVHEEIKRTREQGCSDKNLVKIKETLLKELEQNEKENEFWLNFAKSIVRDGRDWPSIDEYKKWIENLKGEDFKQWAKDFIPDANYKQFVLYPEKKK